MSAIAVGEHSALVLFERQKGITAVPALLDPAGPR